MEMPSSASPLHTETQTSMPESMISGSQDALHSHEDATSAKKQYNY